MSESDEDVKRILVYLNRLIAGRFFQIDDLDSLTVSDLKFGTPIQDIAGDVLEKTLNDFRTDYKSQFFKEVISYPVMLSSYQVRVGNKIRTGYSKIPHIGFMPRANCKLITGGSNFIEPATWS